MIEFILGDLREEFLMLRAERGVTRARLWYVRQLLLSLPVLLKASHMLRPAAIVFPMLLLDRLWCLLYSQIPLKDGLGRAPGFLVANIVCACIGATVVRPSVLSAVVATACGLALAVSVEPAWYICAAMLAVPLAARLRRLYEVA